MGLMNIGFVATKTIAAHQTKVLAGQHKLTIQNLFLAPFKVIHNACVGTRALSNWKRAFRNVVAERNCACFADDARVVVKPDRQ